MIKVKLHGASYFRNYKVSELVFSRGCFNLKRLEVLSCHDIGFAKTTAIYRFPNIALVVENRNGDLYYYNPWYMRWFCNLTNKQLDLFFSRLKPDKGLDKNKTRECSALAGGSNE